MLEGVKIAGEGPDRVGELDRLEGAKAAGRLLEEDAGQNLVLRQAGLRGDREARLVRGAGHRDARHDVGRIGLGDEIELRNHAAVKPDLSPREDQPPANEGERAAQEVEAACYMRIAREPRDVKVPADFGIDAPA